MPVVIAGSTVVKQQLPGRAAREFDKTVAAGQLGRDCGLFVVPQAMGFDAESGTMRLQYLDGYQRLRAALCRADLVFGRRLLRRAGQILAAVHAGLRLGPERMRETWCGDAGTAERQVTVHGDYTLENLMYLPATDSIAVLDWSMAAWLERDVCVAPASIDMTGMLLSIYNQKAVWQREMLAEPEALASEFVDAYSTTTGWRIDQQFGALFGSSLDKYRRAFKKTAGGWYWMYVPRLRRLRRFVSTELCHGAMP